MIVSSENIFIFQIYLINLTRNCIENILMPVVNKLNTAIKINVRQTVSNCVEKRSSCRIKNGFVYGSRASMDSNEFRNAYRRHDSVRLGGLFDNNGAQYQADRTVLSVSDKR